MSKQNTVPYEPLFGRVLIEREVVAKTQGGIIIPDKMQKQHASAKGVVRAIGPTAEGVSAGDEVIFGKYAGTWLDAGGIAAEADSGDAKWFVCNDEDILVKVRAA